MALILCPFYIKLFNMKKLTKLLSVAVLMSTVFFTSCDKDDDDNPVVTSNNTMSGSQEVPAVATTATGSINLSYNKSTKQLTYTVTWNGLSGPATAMHFHGPAVAGVSAGVLIGVTGFTAAASGNATGTLTVPNTGTALETDLLAGKWYFNVHTAANPSGEIRGQIVF
jgi:hypothetical protein